MDSKTLREIWDKTKGHCHFCGDPVTFELRGWKEGSLKGYWEVDHIIQRQKGGSKTAENCLPACTRCNRLRWHRTGKDMRRILMYGLVAQEEINKRTSVGEAIIRRHKHRMAVNRSRRTKRHGKKVPACL